MRKSRRPIVIASRKSPLARAQARAVGKALARLHPHVEVEFLWIESEGDQRLAIPLANVGGKGLFTKAVERALLAGKADIAVHSFKDIPEPGTRGLAIAAVPKRGDVRDCLIAPEADTIEALPQGAVVGTASPRRASQLLARRPDLRIVAIRGNIQTRLEKVNDQRMADATLLAVAGLVRGGLAQHATKPLDPHEFIPAASQGALAVQCRADDHVTLSRCLPLNHPATATAVNIERKIVHGLEGSCHSAIAVLAAPTADDPRVFAVRARCLSIDGAQSIDAQAQGRGRDLDKLAPKLVAELLSQGAAKLLKGVPTEPVEVL